jgi:hypothetical protein
MDNNYIKTDNNKIINERCIRWVRKMDECLYICTKENGCSINIDKGYFLETHKL